jgi:hypothetical protein
MTADSETKTKLVCAECRHENEAERIYCHNCGERLDRSSVATNKKADDPTEAHRRLQKLMQGPSRTRHNFFAGCKLVLAAAATAGVVQMVLPPEFPAAVKTSTPVQLDISLENAAYKPTVMNLSQQDANAYLTYRLAGKKKALNKPLLDFERVAVVFKEGECVVGWQRSIFGYSIYSQASFQVELGQGKISAKNTGGWIGRLPIHPAIMQYADIIFADVFSALDRERKLLAKTSSITFHEGLVTITSGAH